MDRWLDWIESVDAPVDSGIDSGTDSEALDSPLPDSETASELKPQKPHKAVAVLQPPQ